MTATVTQTMREKAEALAAILPMMQTGRSRETGERFYLVPSSDDPINKAHRVGFERGCTCTGNRRRGFCTHEMAATIVRDRQRPNPIASGSRSVEDVENHVARLHLELAARRKRLMLVGWELSEMHEDALYSRISEQLERVRATLQEVAA